MVCVKKLVKILKVSVKDLGNFWSLTSKKKLVKFLTVSVKKLRKFLVVDVKKLVKFLMVSVKT